MTTNDIDAIRSILAALDGRSLDKRPALAGRLAASVPALCDEIEQLRARVMQFAGRLGSAHGERNAACREVARLTVELEKVRGQLAPRVPALCDEIEQLRAARDNLAAYNRVVKKANDDLCAELARVDTALDDAVSQIRELHIERDALRADQRARTQETTR